MWKWSEGSPDFALEASNLFQRCFLRFDARLVVGELSVDSGLGSVTCIGPGLGVARQSLDVADATALALFG